MGGVAQKVSEGVTKPFAKVGQELGVVSKPAASQAAPAAAAPQPAAGPSPAAAAMREEAENTLTRRRMRRAGRALLSDARLNPEHGIQSTLGAGQGL